MTDKELIKLHELKGTLQGLCIIAKCRVRAAHDCMVQASWGPGQGFHQASMRAHVQGLRDIRKAERALDAIIKEAENV